MRAFVPGVDLYADPGIACSDFRGSTIIPGIGHWVQQEAQEETNAALERSCGGCSAGGKSISLPSAGIIGLHIRSPLWGHQRTSGGVRAMSVHPPIANMAVLLLHVRLVPASCAATGNPIRSPRRRERGLIRATPLSENPQSPASRLMARPERSTTIL